MMRMLKLVAAMMYLSCVVSPAMAQPRPQLPTLQIKSPPDARNVRDFGAKGDAATDDTAAFQRAMDECARAGGGKVFAPPGRYLIQGHLSVPQAVSLQGPFDAPPRTMSAEKGEPRGAVLLAVENKGNENGEPFITLHTDSHLHGLIVYYPEQRVETITPYPWTIRGIGDNCSITSCLLINPYHAVDFGTFPAGRHYINGLYAQALKTGLFVDKCFDVGRVENVHFWPFWQDNPKLLDWTRANGTAFRVARTDWEYMTNCFCIAYAIGFHFVANKDGPGNAVLTQCGSDVGPLAVKVDEVQSHSGVSFVNGQIMSRVEIGASNAGPVKFTNCGFWGFAPADDVIRLRGSGHLTLNACHFTWNSMLKSDAPIIAADGGGLTVTGCEFQDVGPSKKHIDLGPDVSAAIITANRFRNPPIIANRCEGDVVIANNAGGKAVGLAKAIEDGNAGKIAELWTLRTQSAPMNTYPADMRLASAIAAKGNMRKRLLRSFAKEKNVPLLVARADDELALDEGQATTRPIIKAMRVQGDAAPDAGKFVNLGAKSGARFAVSWDDLGLYVRVVLEEPSMSSVRAAERQHDGRIWLDDSVELFLAPARVTHRYQQLIVNTLGTWYDGSGDLRGTDSAGWNAQPIIKTAVGDKGWTLDVALSWKDIGHAPPKSGDIWSMDLRRWRYAGGNDEYTSLAFKGAPPKGATHNPEAFVFLKFE